MDFGFVLSFGILPALAGPCTVISAREREKDDGNEIVELVHDVLPPAAEESQPGLFAVKKINAMSHNMNAISCPELTELTV